MFIVTVEIAGPLPIMRALFVRGPEVCMKKSINLEIQG